MSSSESKSQINSKDNNLHSNDSKPVFTKNESINELEPNQRLLTPSRLSEIISTQNRNQSMVYLNTKRLPESEDMSDRQNEELSPLIKRIKKEDNNSKQLIKQELDNGLNIISMESTHGFSSSFGPQIVNSFDSNNDKQINERKVNNDMKTFESLSSEQPIDRQNKELSPLIKGIEKEDNNYLDSESHKSRIKVRPKRKRKNPKGKHTLEESKVIKELKVKASKRLTPEEVQLLIAFRNEGVVRMDSRPLKRSIFKCLLCCLRITELQSVEEHIKSYKHITYKCEQNYSKIESMFALDLGKNSDIEVLISRRRLLSQLNRSTKEHLHSKGIRVKNGFGSDAFVCIECNEQPFKSLDDVFNHLEKKSKLMNDISMESKPGFSASFGPQIVNSFESNNDKQINESNVNKVMETFKSLSSEQINKLFESEGIVPKIRQQSKKKGLKYLCPICKIDNNNEYQTFKHINHKIHLRAKAKVLKSKPGFSASFGPQIVDNYDSNNDKQTNDREVNNDMKTFESHSSEQIVELNDRQSKELSPKEDNNCLLSDSKQELDNCLDKSLESKPGFSASFGPQIVNSFDSNTDKQMNKKVNKDMEAFKSLSSEQLIKLFESEGIVRKFKSRRKRCLIHFCMICKKKRNTDYDIFKHIGDRLHLREKARALVSKSGFNASFGPQIIDSFDSNNDKQMNDTKVNNDMNTFESPSSEQMVELNDRKNPELSPIIKKEDNNCLPFDSKQELDNCLDKSVESKPGFSSSFGPQIVNSFDSNNDKQMNKRNPNDYKEFFESISSEQINKLFESEGIVSKIRKRSKKKGLTYFCTVCEEHRANGYEMFLHLANSRHLAAKARIK